MTPTDKDLAEFAGLGLRLRLLETVQIQSWADNFIAAHDQPPAWVIDLSMAQGNEMGKVLNTVPGQISGDLPIKMLWVWCIGDGGKAAFPSGKLGKSAFSYIWKIDSRPRTLAGIGAW